MESDDDWLNALATTLAGLGRLLWSWPAELLDDPAQQEQAQLEVEQTHQILQQLVGPDSPSLPAEVWRAEILPRLAPEDLARLDLATKSLQQLVGGVARPQVTSPTGGQYPLRTIYKQSELDATLADPTVTELHFRPGLANKLVLGGVLVSGGTIYLYGPQPLDEVTVGSRVNAIADAAVTRVSGGWVTASGNATITDVREGRVDARGTARVINVSGGVVKAAEHATVIGVIQGQVTASDNATITDVRGGWVTAFNTAKVINVSGGEVNTTGSATVTGVIGGTVHAVERSTVTEVTSGEIWVDHDSTVNAAGGRIEARGQAQVTASGNARVRALNEATVTGQGEDVRIWAVNPDHVTVDDPRTVQRLPDELRNVPWEQLESALE